MSSANFEANQEDRDYRIVVILFLFGLFLPLSLQDYKTGINKPVPQGNEIRSHLAGNGVENKELRIQYPYFFFEPILINRATVEQLCLIPGIGPSYANKIVNWREQHQQIQSKQDLVKINGIGNKRADTIAEHVSFEVIDD